MSDPSFYKTRAWKAARLIACQRAGWCCSSCKRSVRAKHQARVDHIIPYKRRPDLGLVQQNLRVLCPSCDAARHHEKGGHHIEREQINNQGFPPSWS